MALLLLAATTNPARADCPAAPIADPDDMAISFLAANGVQAGSASLLASTVKEGIVVYDDANDTLKLCDGNNWIEVGSGSGTDTLASLSCTAGQIAKFNGTVWACAADGGGGSGGSAVAFSARRTAGNVASGNTVIFDSASINTGSGYNAATGVFTAPVAGSYQFSWGSIGNISSNDIFRLVLRKNGASTSLPQARSYNDKSSEYPPTATALGYLTLVQGDTVNVHFQSDNGTALYGTGSYVFFNGHLLGGGSGSDTLATLSCDPGQVPEWGGSNWICGTGSGSSGPGPAFAATKGSAQTIPADTATKLTWTTEEFDTNNNFDLANGRFTPTVAGSYAVTLSVGLVASASGDWVSGLISKNGSYASRSTDVAVMAANGLVVTTSTIVRMNGTTDYLEGWAQSNLTSIPAHGARFTASLVGGGGADTLAGLSCTTNEIPKWNGSAWACAADGGGSSGPGVAFSANRNGTDQTVTSGTTTPINWTDEAFDTNNNFDPGTDRFTPTVAGTYILNVMAKCSNSTDYCIVMLFKNGATIADSRNRHTGGDRTASATAIAEANGSTDYFTASVYSTGTTINGGIISTNFSGALLGGGGGSTTAAGSVAGAVQFNDGSDAFAADDVNLFWDDTNKRLGIGTTSPARPLEVLFPTSAASAQMRLSSSGGGYTDLNSFDGGGGGLDTIFDINPVGDATSPAAIRMFRATNTTGNVQFQILRGDGSTTSNTVFGGKGDSYLNAVVGNVGIGTTSPASLLHVAGGIQLGDDAASCPGASNVKLGTLRYASNTLSVCNSGGWTALGSGGGTAPAGNDGSIQFKSGSNLAADAANLHWDDTNNRLGIGTTAPAQAVHIMGRLQVEATLPQVIFRETDVGADNKQWKLYPSDSEFVGTATNDADSAGRVWMRVRRAGTTINSVSFPVGRLGLGLETPGEVFHLRTGGANTPSGRMVIDATSGGSYLYIDPSAGPGSWSGITQAGDTALIFSGGTPDTGGFVIAPWGSTPYGGLRMTETGKVGIGTTTPASVLHVAGGIQLADDAASCPGSGNIKLGTLKYLSNVLSVCNSGGWTALTMGSDASTLGGLNAATTATANTIVARDANADTAVRYLQSTYVAMSHGASVRNADTIFYSSMDNYIRKNTAAGFRTSLDVYAKGEVDTLVSSAGDNLGNHTATQAINMGGFAINNAGAITSTGGLVVSAASANQARIKHGNFGVILRNDGTNYYHLLTNSGDADGGWNSLRPFTINLSSGAVSMANGLTVTGSVAATTFSGSGASLTNLNASNLTTGTVATARLGSGTANSSTFLRGDGTWQAVPAGTVTGSGSANHIAYWTGSSGIAHDANQLVWDATNNRLGVGVASPSYAIDTNSTIRAAAYQYTSDRRLKTDIETAGGLDIVTRLHGVSFRWKDSGKAATGVIAQEVEEVLPAAVATDGKGMKSVDYPQMIGPMIEAIKELKADNDELRAANDNQSAELHALRAEIETLKRLTSGAH